MYGFIAVFDDATEQLVKNIWAELHEKTISSYAYEVKDRIPHITIASYNRLNTEQFMKHMDVHYCDQSALDITFSSIGTFLQSGALYLAPTVTKQLLTFHENHHKNFQHFNDDPESLYLPGRWIPHCTLANRLPQEKLIEAFKYCSERIETVFAQIQEVALIDLTDKGKAPIIYSKDLKRNEIPDDKMR